MVKKKTTYKYLAGFVFILLCGLAFLFYPTLSSRYFLSETKPVLASVIDKAVVEENNSHLAYLPLIRNGANKFIGIVMPVYWSQENVIEYMPEANDLAGGKRHSAVSWGIDIQDPALYEPWNDVSDLETNNLYRQLEQLWLEGYFSFVKIGSSSTIKEIASGGYDSQLNQMAQIYKIWSEKGSGRKAMFAPFQEMNGEWVPYYYVGESPSQKQKDFKDAYNHILNIFQDNGVDRSDVWWVFSPNGWSWPEDNFEYYYPGDDVVDLVGFAAYNFGFCEATVKPDGNDYGNWENYDRIYEPYINRLQTMAPTKYILISETGTSALTSVDAREQLQYDYDKKAEWLSLNYGWLAKQPSVLGVFYFDFNDLGNNVACDLGIPRSNFTGYKDAVANPIYQYLDINDLETLIR